MTQKKKPNQSGKAASVLPQASEPVAGQQYVVLARKYRPQTFDDLIGQQAMVTTLSNAFATDRIAQGYMLTGVRGVGKTTTARILARALNYSLPVDQAADGKAVDRPTIDMPVLGEHCAQIMESRHPDVLEMDAASNTGIDNIREIIESARYKPMVARYKVYIIDEVHMLSKGAFNALLKTLEEPPEHVKFIFATTEIRKVPVTVLSRCQRFDLRRVDVPALSKHFAMITKAEGAAADDEALNLIARAAEGSVRDGLSILDQAIAISLGEAAQGTAAAGGVSADAVRAMLGLADRGRIFDLLENLFGGKAGEALEAMSALHHDGAEAVQILSDLAEAVHVTARLKTVGPDGAGAVLSAEEKRRAAALAENLSMGLLSRAWQMLLKGSEETAKAANPLAAAEMVLIRLAYTADLPSPEEVIKTLGGGAPRGAAPSASPAPGSDRAPPGAPLNVAAPDGASNRPPLAASAPTGSGHPGRSASQHLDDAPPWRDDQEAERAGSADLVMSEAAPAGGFEYDPMPKSFADVIALVAQHRDMKLVFDLEEQVSLVKFEPPKIDLHLLSDANKDLGNQLREKLNSWTGQNWIVALSSQAGAPPVGQVKRQRHDAQAQEIKALPAIKSVLDEFPGAKIRDIRALPGQRDKTDKAKKQQG